MVAVHGELNEAKLRLGVRTKLSGVENKTFAQAEAAPASLRDVG